MQSFYSMKKSVCLLFTLLLGLTSIRSVFSQTIADEQTGQFSWREGAEKQIILTEENFGLVEEPGIIHAEPLLDYSDKSPFPEKYDARDFG